MNSNGENNGKSEMNEQNLEQVAGGLTWMRALYRCPVCQHEEERTTCARFHDTIRCICGAYMVLLPKTIHCVD